VRRDFLPPIYFVCVAQHVTRQIGLQLIHIFSILAISKPIPRGSLTKSSLLDPIATTDFCFCFFCFFTYNDLVDLAERERTKQEFFISKKKITKQDMNSPLTCVLLNITIVACFEQWIYEFAREMSWRPSIEYGSNFSCVLIFLCNQTLVGYY
jgi:hypothetical protein